MSDKPRVLVVDDDENIAELISLYLTKECYESCIAHDGETAITEFERFQPHIVVLDIMLPGIDGYGVLRAIRAKSTCPVIMLSAKGEVFDKVLGLELGADDYMVKPFDSKELVARVKAISRRYQNVSNAAEDDAEPKKLISYPNLTVNLDNYEVTYMGEIVDMPPKELELLYFLASTPNRVYTREQLLEKIWGYEYSGDTRTVDVHIKRVREKIQDTKDWSLVTVWGVGYKFDYQEKK